MIKPLLLTASLLFSGIHATATDLTVSPDHSSVCVNGQNFTLSPSSLLLTAGKIKSPYAFNDALSAISAINSSEATNVTLFVEPSVYWLDNPDDPEIRRDPKNSGSIPYAAEIRCDTLSIIGLADNPEDVVFAVNRGQTQGALGNYTMLHFIGKSLHTENMTFGNYCNVDLIYPKDPSLNRPKRRDAIVQAQLGICDGTDRVFARNCRFISRLNLCPMVGGRRSLYKDCYFECTDDALTGSAVYLDCKFTFHSGKPFYTTASTGAVFLNCDIHTLVNGVQYLTKAPGMVTMIDTRFTAENPVKLQWTRDISPIRCYQSGITLNGNPVTIDADRPELSTDITESPLLEAYKIINEGKNIYNTPNLLGGNDGWDPLGMLTEVRKAETAQGKSLTSRPVALKINVTSRPLTAQGDTLHLTTSPICWGDYPAIGKYNGIRWSAPTTIKLSTSGLAATATSANMFPRKAESIITAVTSDGLTGATKVTVEPYLKDAPEFSAFPSVKVEKGGAKVSYKLSADGNDDSYIVWYRSTRPDGADSIPVRHGRGLSGATYTLSSADHGYFITAAVSPKLDDTRQGTRKSARLECGAITKKISKASPKKERTLLTSFAEIPIIKTKGGKPGFWHFDSYKPADTQLHDWKADPDLSWYYGQATDASTGTGLVQATRGARLSYTPTITDCKAMSLSLVAEPCKGPGQGFGSATGQYMDVCIRFDPQTLSGYGLRIERTPDYDKAVTFTLVRYADGNVSPISIPVASNCFRNPCHISLELKNGILSANAYTEAPSVGNSNPDVKSAVSISAKTSIPTTHNSFAIQHTGSVGASATLIRDLKVTWE